MLATLLAAVLITLAQPPAEPPGRLSAEQVAEDLRAFQTAARTSWSYFDLRTSQDGLDLDKAVKDVCTYRRRHVEEYAALQAAYQAFALVLREQPTRVDGTAATAHLAAMLRSCIDHKSELTTGGQNVGIDMIPNGIAAQCLRLGTEFLTAETQQMQGE